MRSLDGDLTVSRHSGDDDTGPTASLEALRLRARVLQQVRRLFDSHGYWEVQTPLLSVDTCVDAWIDPFAIPGIGPGGETCYLQTSPEFAMKRLLAAGADAIYEITRSFRQGEAGIRHNPEFTMVEWYRAGDDHFGQMSFTEMLIREVAATEGVRPIPLPSAPFIRLTYDEAFERAVGTRVLERPTEDLIGLARQLDVPVPESLDRDDRDGWLNLLLALRVEPFLPSLGPVFLFDFPASQAALAMVRPGPPAVAERFELYIDGLELCNGYHELSDASELIRRMQQQSQRRVAAGKEALPDHSRLARSLQQGTFPTPAAGVALGFERLLMWLIGTQEIAKVMAFPFARA